MYLEKAAISVRVSFDFPFFLFSKTIGISPIFEFWSLACLTVSIWISYVSLCNLGSAFLMYSLE